MAMMMVMVVMMMVMMPVASDHDDRATPHMAVVMMMVVHLSQPHISFRGLGRRLLIQGLQCFCRIRDRLEQVGVGIRR
jgi:hypothetical protein